jgi:hypothetical protein
LNRRTTPAIIRAAMRGLLCCSALLAGCATTVDYVTGERTLNRYDLQDDVEIGTKMASLVLASTEQLGLITDPDDAHTRAVWRVAARLLAVQENRARMPPLPWELHTVGADNANAWCFPGGQVLVLAGLLRQGMVRDEDELAAVLGHELAHAAARHGTERMTFDHLRRMIAPLGAFFGPRLVALATPADPERTLRALAADTQQYDREQEREADLVGLELMARAGYDPSRAAGIWQRLAEAGLSDHGLRTHPAHEDRVRELAVHVPVARYVAGRSSAPSARPAEEWRWTPAARTGSVALDARGALPGGAHVARTKLSARRDVLNLEARIFSGPGGEAPRAALILRAARDLYEDRLPFFARLRIVAEERRDRLWFERRLAEAAPIEGPYTSMRVAIPRLPPGQYRLLAEVEVGALAARSSRRFDVAAPQPASTERIRSAARPSPNGLRACAICR